jgi:hypothetical protein
LTFFLLFDNFEGLGVQFLPLRNMMSEFVWLEFCLWRSCILSILSQIEILWNMNCCKKFLLFPCKPESCTGHSYGLESELYHSSWNPYEVQNLSETQESICCIKSPMDLVDQFVGQTHHFLHNFCASNL